MNEWQNKGYEIYKELEGEEKYEKRMKEIFEIPEPGFGSSLGLWWAMKKLQFLLSLKTIMTKLRGSHPSGVGALGTAKIVDNPTFPESDFFVGGREFPVRLRHSNTAAEHDDLVTSTRGCAVKFCDQDDGGPFDLVCNTGRVAAFCNIPTFMEFAMASATGNFKDAALNNPLFFYGLCEARRKNPSSYESLRYYAAITYEYKPTNGKSYLAKFRVIPKDGRAETGLLNEEQQREPWLVQRDPNDTRPKTWLRDSFKESVAKEPVEYTIQIQLHETTDYTPDSVLFCIAKEWQPESHPWHNLAHVTLTSTLDDAITETTRFNISNHPCCLSIPEPESQQDYRSIAYVRQFVYQWASSWRPSNKN